MPASPFSLSSEKRLAALLGLAMIFASAAPACDTSPPAGLAPAEAGDASPDDADGSSLDPRDALTPEDDEDAPSPEDTPESDADDAPPQDAGIEDTATPDDVPPDTPDPPTPDVDEAPDADPMADAAQPEPDVEEPCTQETAWQDRDGDGQGDPNAPLIWCVERGLPDGASENRLDCDDDDPQVFTGARLCSADGRDVAICANGLLRIIEVCGFDKECFIAPDGPHCGCPEGERRCEEWFVRICAPDRLEYSGHDCRPDDCDGDRCPGCTIAFAFRDADRDGQGNLHDYRTHCIEDGLPSGFVSTGTDCRDADPTVKDGDQACAPRGDAIIRCEQGWEARVESCPGGCVVTGPGRAACR